MLIQDAYKPRRRRALLQLAVAVAAILLLLLFILLSPEPSPYQDLPADVVYCGAEKEHDGQFFQNGVYFSGGRTQSGDCARYGRYGSLLPPGDTMPTGMGYTLEQARPGQAYRASVWFRAEVAGTAFLAAEVEGTSPRQWSSDDIATTDSLGWSQLQLYCYVPYGARSTRLRIYAYGSGSAKVCFDDLLITPLPEPAAFTMPRLEIKASVPLPSAARNLPVKLEWGNGKHISAKISTSTVKHPAFRLELQSDSTWNGLQQFTLEPVKSTEAAEAWLLHQLWKKAGLLTTDYDFAEVYYNGRSLGLYAYEERTGRQFINRSPYPDGPIVEVRDFGHSPSPLVQPILEPADSLRSGGQMVQAQRLFMQYHQSRGALQQVAEVPQLAQYFAIAALLDKSPATALRWYYNPLTDQLHPIAWGQPESKDYMRKAKRQLMENEAFAAHYLSVIYHCSEADSARALLDPLAAEWEARAFYLKRALTDSLPSMGSLLHHLQEQREELRPTSEYTVTAYTQSIRGPLRQLKIINQHHLPLRIFGYGRQAGSPQAGLDKPLVLWPASWQDADSDSLFTELDVASAANYLFYRLPGIEQVFSARILPQPAPEGLTDWQRLSRSYLPKANASYTLSEKQLVFSEGTHELKENLVVPSDYTLVLQAGAEIILDQKASLISLGVVRATGRPDLPVRIRSRYSGGGFALLRAEGTSDFQYVRFEQLQPPAFRDWQLSAGFTVYESDVLLRNCAWLKGRGEAAVQSTRSEVASTACLVSQAEQTGWKMDYCQAQLTTCRFEQCQENGIVLHRSQVGLKAAVFLDNPRYALTATAASRLQADGGSVTGSQEAVRAADGANIHWSGLRMTDCAIGFAAFQKKPEFGPAQLVLSGLRAESVSQLQRSNGKSRVRIE